MVASLERVAQAARDQGHPAAPQPRRVPKLAGRPLAPADEAARGARVGDVDVPQGLLHAGGGGVLPTRSPA